MPRLGDAIAVFYKKKIAFNRLEVPAQLWTGWELRAVLLVGCQTKRESTAILYAISVASIVLQGSVASCSSHRLFCQPNLESHICSTI